MKKCRRAYVNKIHTVEEVEVDEEFIVAVFRNDQENQRSEEKLADGHVEVHVKSPEATSRKRQ